MKKYLETHLAEYFDSGVRARGDAYKRTGAVRLKRGDAWEVQAQVRGGDQYAVTPQRIRRLGQLDAGYYASWNLSPDGGTSAIGTTYFARGSHGARTDVVEFADVSGVIHMAATAKPDGYTIGTADNALVVGHVSSARTLASRGQNVVELSGGLDWRALVKALRPHQWVKNILLVLPMIAAHRFDLVTLIPILWGIVAFSAAASSIYIVNDLLDLEADRLHPTKRNRPFASGALPITVGMAVFAACALIAVTVAAALNMSFLGVILLYMVTSLAYSLKLKRMRWVDVATLAALYTIRVIAGAAAAQVYVSIYMLIFIFPIFITLGCVKRLTELTLATSDERLPGRGYGRPDRGDLLNVAWLGTIGALLIFFRLKSCLFKFRAEHRHCRLFVLELGAFGLTGDDNAARNGFP